MKFHHFADRSKAWSNRNRLPSGVYLTEDFPQEIQRRRRKLVPYLALARTVPTVKTIRLVEDKLIIDGVVYTEHTLDKLPEDIRGKPTATLSKDGITAFHTKDSPLSNLYPCPITMDGHKYTSVEHFYGVCKAKHAMDQPALDNINKNPADAQRLSKTIHMPSRIFEEWKNIRCSILKKAMLAKFTQNPELSPFLKNTGDRILIEATRDKYWGVGRGIGDPSLFNKDNWPGLNTCGKMIMEIRDELSC